MAFISCNNGDLKKVFITEAEILDRFVGNELFAWGLNQFGQLGDNSTINKSSPVQTVTLGSNWKQVSFGGLGHVGAIKTDGTLWLWGCNPAGELGNNNIIGRSSPVQTVSSGTNWKCVSTNTGGGAGFTSAIKTDGTLWLWGCAASGVLGNNSTINRSSPVQTSSAGTNWYRVSNGSNHTSAIKTDGTLWVWGSGAGGGLGTNSTTNQSNPVQTSCASTDWKQVSAGSTNTAAIKTDGTLWLWGCNNVGTIGDNSTTNKSVPVQTVSSGTTWKQVSLSFSTSAAIKIDGTLWLWGCGASAALGNNSTTNRSSPVQTVSTGTNWKQVAVGCLNASAIKTDGTLWLWGSGTHGSLGDNSTTNKSSPVQTVTLGTNWKQVTKNGYQGNSAAITFTDI